MVAALPVAVLARRRDPRPAAARSSSSGRCRSSIVGLLFNDFIEAARCGRPRVAAVALAIGAVVMFAAERARHAARATEDSLTLARGAARSACAQACALDSRRVAVGRDDRRRRCSSACGATPRRGSRSCWRFPRRWPPPRKEGARAARTWACRRANAQLDRRRHARLGASSATSRSSTSCASSPAIASTSSRTTAGAGGRDASCWLSLAADG